MTSRSSSDQPAVIRCKTSADFLATLPFMMGYDVRNSVVVALFDGNQAAQAIRIDLPPPHVPHSETGIEQTILSVISRLKRVSSVALVIYTDEPFSVQGEAPRLLMTKWVERALTLSGVEIRDVCCVTPDSWASLHSPEAYTGGRPIRELSESMSSFEARRHTDAPLTDMTTLGKLASPDANVSRRFKRAIRSLGDELFPPEIPADAEAVTVLLQRLTRAITSTSEPDLNDYLTLIHCTTDCTLWFLSAFACLFSSDRHLGHDRDLGQSAFSFIHSPTASVRELSERLTLASSSRIQPRHLKATASHLAYLATNTPKRHRSGLLLLLAWLWWMGGLMTPADEILGTLEANQEENLLIGVLRRVIDAGPPMWAYSDE